MNNTFELNINQIIELKELIKKYFVIKKNNALYYKIGNTTITIFSNNKVLIQGTNIHEVLDKYFSNYKPSIKKIKSKIIPTNIILNQSLIGCDEVGVGDSFGGLISCACYVPINNIEYLKSLGVADSKKINDKNIKGIIDKIAKYINFEICNISASKYNELYEKYQNSHIIKTKLHVMAVNKLKQKYPDLKSTKIVLDAFVSENKIHSYLNDINEDTNFFNYLYEKSESYFVCVACASIIARYYFLLQINNMSNKYDFNFKLGSSNINNNINDFIKIYGKEELKKVAKLHFTNIKNFIEN